VAPMNEASLSQLPFWGPSEGLFLINSTAVGLTRMKRSSFELGIRVIPWVNLGERFIRVNPTDVQLRKKPPHWDPKTASGLNTLRSLKSAGMLLGRDIEVYLGKIYLCLNIMMRRW